MLSTAVSIRKRFLSFVFGAAFFVMFLVGCSQNMSDRIDVLRLATTTSTRDSELLDQLLPEFEKSHACRVNVIAVGTGAALKLGEAGDVDVLLVHARHAEKKFMDAQHGARHEEIMYNDFVLLGPQNDPAEIRSLAPADALQKIAKGKHRFLSRGDNSGTHMREISLWQATGGRPNWKDYIESGQGMGPTVVMADEKQGYVLADKGTFLRFQEKISLVSLTSDHNTMRNPYAVITVNPEKHKKINGELANQFVDFLISESTQQTIAGYQLFGQTLFHPSRLSNTK